METRNIAIIAHVDHGKTTLTDALMQQTGMITDDTSMDSNALEQERGITIYSKNTSIFYKDTKINIVDTPGHADFGSEVERVLRSIDSVLLIVDAQEGPMPQTKFVLRKALELGIKPIVILNKIDKPASRPEWVQDQVLELFMDLGANDEQLDFTTLFAIAKNGTAVANLTDEHKNLEPILDAILTIVEPATANTEAPFTFQPFNLAYDNHLGRMGIGRVYEGKISKGDDVWVRKNDGTNTKGKISTLFTFEGIKRKQVSSVEAGDIVMIAGLPTIFIGDTITTDENRELLPAISIDSPTISMNFLVNNSPFAGREGTYVTGQQIRERLEKELEVNVGLQVDFSNNDAYTVYGRGELHIAILLENMRREGFELQVSQPHVIIKEIDGKKHEPFELLTIDCPEEFVGTIIEKLARRKGNMTHMDQDNGNARLNFEIPTRGLLGYRNEFIIDTKGEGILCSENIGFRPHVGEIQKTLHGSMISMTTGKVLGYALANLQTRGQLYIKPNIEVYEGMVVGNTAKGEDMTVNPTKGKQLTNMRSSGADDAINLTPPIEITLERGLEIINDDEYLEVTPQSIRLRKQHLTESERKKASKSS